MGKIFEIKLENIPPIFIKIHIFSAVFNPFSDFPDFVGPTTRRAIYSETRLMEFPNRWPRNFKMLAETFFLFWSFLFALGVLLINLLGPVDHFSYRIIQIQDFLMAQKF